MMSHFKASSENGVNNLINNNKIYKFVPTFITNINKNKSVLIHIISSRQFLKLLLDSHRVCSTILLVIEENYI